MSYPYLARTTLKYKSPHATDLSFAKDETIRVTGQSEDDEDWLLGESEDGSRSGGFPKDFVTPIDTGSADQPATTAPQAAAAPTTTTTQPESDPAPPPAPADAPPPPSPKLEPKSLPQSPAPSQSQPPSAITTEAPQPPPPAAAPAPTTRTPVTETVPPPSGTGDEPDPSQMTLKDRMAFFAAAQKKAGPPPPVKPKPAAGGLTWSQRQKLKQEQDAKEKEAGGEASQPSPTPAASSAIPKSVTESSAPVQSSTPSSPKQEKKEGTGMSAADAQTSIGKGGSLKERMAALQGAGAFGKSEEPKPAAPAPSGKVWKRPTAPEREEGDDAEGEEGTVKSPLEEGGDGLDEAGAPIERTEEEEEKARKAAIAARMAKLGARGPMSMAIPPKPARKPTREALASPTTEDKSKPTTLALDPSTLAANDDKPLSPSAEAGNAIEAQASSPTAAATSPPTSVPMPAIARRTAPPRRKAPTSSTTVPANSTETAADKGTDSIGPNNGAEPPPQVMAYDEEKPIPKTDAELAAEKEREEAGRGSAGADGAKAAGIAMAPVNTADLPSEDKSQPTTGMDGGAESERGLGGDVVDGKEGEPVELEDGLEEGGQEQDTIMREAQSGGLLSGTQQPQMVPLHSPAESAHMVDDGETPPPPPPRMSMSDLPRDEVEMKHGHDLEDSKVAQNVDEDVDEGDEDLAPPPPQRDARRSIGGGEKPLGPRPLPSPGKVGSAPLPPPPQGNPLVPPRDDSEDEDENDEEREANEENERIDEDEEDEDEDIPPPPPARRPSVPVPAPLQMPSSSGPGPTSPRAAQSPVPQSPMSPKRTVPPPQAAAAASVDDPAPAQSQSPEDEEATRRSNIAARMAKLGGIKFGAPPPVPATKRSMSTEPSSAIDENPKSPIREAPPPPANEDEEGGVINEESAHRAVSPPITATAPEAEGEETPEQEAARRRATLARLRAGGSLGFGMFGQGGHQAAASPSEDRGLEEQIPESEETEERGSGTENASAPPVPSSRPPPPALAALHQPDSDDEAPPPPPPPGRPGSHSRSATAESASFMDPSGPPPPPSGRPPVPSNRPIPAPPAAAQSVQIDEDSENEGAPPPPPRPAQSPSLPPPSPMGGRPPIPSSDKRGSMTQPSNIRTDLPPPPIERQMTEEPGDMSAPPPPPARLPPAPSSPVPASPRRSTSIASRSSFQQQQQQQQQGMTPASRQGSRLDEQPPQSPAQGQQPPLRTSMSQSRPGFNELQEASKQNGSRLIRAAKAMFSQGKQAYFGDGSPAGFVLVALDNAHLPRPQNSWGYVILEQEGSSVLKRSDEPRPGDIVAFYDAKLKGKKGLSSYSQNVGSVEEPLVGVVSESETKKHKLRVLQVERGVPEEVSYRCDDLKSGRVVVYRPGV